MSKANHDPNFLRERKAARNVKRGLVRSTIMERFYRRRLNLCGWVLTELGREMLGDDQDDQGGVAPLAPLPINPFPSGLVIAELAF